MTRINMDLVDQVMAEIKDNQERWAQGYWSQAKPNQDVAKVIGAQGMQALLAEDPYNPACGTTFCFAGHAAVQTGWKPKFQVTDDGIGMHVFALDRATKGGRESSIRLIAKDELGLHGYEADLLFDGHNTMETLEGMVEYMRKNDCLDSDWNRERHECDCVHCDIEYEDEV